MSVGGAGGAGGSRGAGNAAAAARAAAAEARRRAAEEARRRAEAARRAAEAARRAAEAAKKAAEAQRRAAAEAERRAQVSKQQVARKRQSLATTTEPRARQTLQKEVAQLHQKATTSSQDAAKAHTAAVTAEQRAQAATRAAQEAERSANELAKKVGLPAPFQNVLDTDTSGFDGPRPGDDKPALRGDTRASGGQSAPQQLAADAAYHKVAGEPGGKKTLEALGIEDGKSLLTYSQGLGGGTGDTRLADMKGAFASVDPRTQQLLLEQMSFLSPGLKNEVSRDGDLQRVMRGEGTQAEPTQAKTDDKKTEEKKGNEPRPTAEEVAAMPPKDKEALDAIGVKPEELVGTGTVAEELVAAGHAALEQDWDGAFEHLEAAAAQPAAQELVAKVVSNAASHLPEGSPARELLSDSKLVGEFLQAGGDLVALSQAKTLDEAATALENLTANPELTEALKNNTYIAGQLDALGIKPEQFDEALTALPDLLRAGAALTAEPPDATAALEHLASAAALAPNVVASAVTTAAQRLPPGPARDLLTDPNLVAQVARLAPDLLGALASATPEEALTRLAGLASDEQLQSALLANPTVSKALTDLGITDPALQQEALAALPHVLNAAVEMTRQPEPNYPEALRHLAKAAQTAPGLAANLMGAAAEKLPEGDPARELLTDEALMKEVLEGAPAVLDKLLTGDVPGALTELSALAEDPELQKELSENPVVTRALDTLGVPADQRDEALKALPELLKAAAALSQQPEADVKGALRHLGAAAQQLPELGATLVANAAARLPDTDPAKKLLTDTALMTEVLKQGGDVMELLLTDKVDEALGKLAGILDNAPLQQALANNALVKEKLTALGITDPAMQAEALKVLPDILRVGAALTENPVPWDEVLSLVGNVAKNAPLAMGAVGAQLASKIPDDSPHAYLKPLLSNGPLLQTLVEKGPEALKQVLSGDPAQMAQGVATLLADPVISEGVATALLASPAGAFLRDQLGITDPKQLAGLLQVAPDLVKLGEALAKPDMDAALAALGGVLDHVRNTDSDLLTRMLGTVADKLGLSPEVRAVFNAAADVLAAPGGVDALKNLVASLAPPEPTKFADAIGQLGGVLEGMLGSDEGKLKVENLLTALGAALPGNIGALFKDPALNKGLVQSGALGTVFQAARELVNGNLETAVTLLGEAAGKLLGHPEDQRLIRDDIPLTTEGLKNFARLFKGLFDTLPNSIKNKIEAAVVSATGGLLGNIPFIGDAIDAGKDVLELIREYNDDDLEGMLLAAGQLVVDGAKFTQVGKPFVAPLETALTLLQAVDDVMDNVNEMKSEFSRIMTEGGDDTVYTPLDEDKRKLIQEMSKYEVPSEVALEVVTQYTELSPGMMRDLVKLADSMGVPPEQFGEFLRRMNEQIGGDEDGEGLEMFVAAELRAPGGPINNGEVNGGVTGWTQDYFNNNYPEVAQWTQEVAGPTGQDDAIIRDAFKNLYGRAPTETELAQWRDDMTELRDSEGNPRDAYYELCDRIKESDEYRATHPQ